MAAGRADQRLGRAARDSALNDALQTVAVPRVDNRGEVFEENATRRGRKGKTHFPGVLVNNLEQFYASVEKLRAIQDKTNATMVFGHDADQIHQLRTAPQGSYT